MTIFDEAKHARDRRGQFAEQTRTEPDIDLAAGSTQEGLTVGRGSAGRSSVGEEYTRSSTKQVVAGVDCQTQVTHHVFAVDRDGHEVSRQQHDRADTDGYRYGVRSQRAHTYTADGNQLERTTNSTWGEKKPYGSLKEAEAAARRAAEEANLADYDPQPWAEPFISPDERHPEGRWLGSSSWWDASDDDPETFSEAELGHRADEAADRYEHELDALQQHHPRDIWKSSR